jgi:hypothetical protein
LISRKVESRAASLSFIAFFKATEILLRSTI